MKCQLLASLAAYIFLISAVNADRSKQNCDLLGRNFYDELKCKPKTIPGRDCPFSYTCPEYKIDPKYCTFLGVRYNISEVVNGTSYCNVACFCEGGNKFQCAVVDCYWGPDEQPECYRTYELGKCCPNFEKKCPPFDKVPKCELNGKTYKEGEVMDTGDTCWNCICRAGFKGIFEEPYCIRSPCDVELHYSDKIAKKCAPVYRNYEGKSSRCCPSGFLCPDDVKDIQIVRSATHHSGRHHCKFGNYKLKKNDYFIAPTDLNSKPSNGTCTCLLPPYVSCVAN